MAASFVFFGIDLAEVDWYFVFYILFSMAAVGLGVKQLFPMGAPTAIIYGIGAIMVLIFYAYRWFDLSKNAPPLLWPPTINTCPDYLTYISSLPGSTTPGCVDLLGVSKNGSLQKVLSTDLTASAPLQTTKIFGKTSKDVLGSDSNIQSICDLCRTKGVTWEGVFDGDNCVALTNKGATRNASCPSG
jgi:hypothetical protein